MKTNISKKIISIFLILSMLSHLTYLHELLDNYVLCYGNDGHIAIENINNDFECEITHSSKSMVYSNISSNTSFQNNNCNDVSLGNDCYEDSQFLIDSKTNFTFNTNPFILNLPRTKQKPVFLDIKDQLFSKNLILENYTTVSLLI